MYFDFANVLVFFAVGMGFVGVALGLSRFLAPHRPSAAKEQPYECGEPPIGASWSQFNIRFYIIAIIFLIFDVELAFMYPVSTVYSEFIALGQGVQAMLEIFVFVLILFVGLIYVWFKGDLTWIKTFKKLERER